MAALIPPAGDLGIGEGYHSPQVDVAVRLNTNESPWPPPQEWVGELSAAVSRVAHNRYPDRSYRALRQAIASQYGVHAEQVFVANGSNEVLQTLLLAYGGPGRTAAVFEPTYALHRHIAGLTRTALVSGQRGSDLLVAPGELGRLLADAAPDIVFLCSPNNPSGRSEPEATVRTAAELAPGLVVVDEAYGQFATWSAIEMVADDAGVVVVRTFSKTWSMAADRLGYLIGPRSLVAVLDKVVLPYHLDSVKQEAGRLALAHRPEMERRVAAIVTERQRVVAALEGLAERVWPSDANFVLFRPGGDATAVWRGLVERSVLVRDCSSWPGLDGCLRVTIGRPEENDAFLSALEELMR
jgi:histidinol-phosphate aminotransferase